MKPIFKEYSWSETGFRDVFGMDFGSETESEAYTVSTSDSGKSIIANGEFEGKTIGEAAAVMKEKLLGDYVLEKYNGKFPVLVKLIDCTDKLSIQVHTDDEYASLNENASFGKTEMWYVLSAKPGAKLIYGFNRDVTKEDFKKALENGDLDVILNYVDVENGDAFYIKEGTFCALLDGLLIAKIQQNCDTTYRVFDHNIVDKSGKSRELDVINLNSSVGGEKIKQETIKEGGKGNFKTPLVKCSCFNVEKHKIKEKTGFVSTKKSFDIIIITEGRARMFYGGGSIAVKTGDCVLVPAYIGKYTVEGNCEFLKSDSLCQ